MPDEVKEELEEEHTEEPKKKGFLAKAKDAILPVSYTHLRAHET